MHTVSLPYGTAIFSYTRGLCNHKPKYCYNTDVMFVEWVYLWRVIRLHYYKTNYAFLAAKEGSVCFRGLASII